jgi:hypothetical protein
MNLQTILIVPPPGINKNNITTPYAETIQKYANDTISFMYEVSTQVKTKSSY